MSIQNDIFSLKSQMDAIENEMLVKIKDLEEEENRFNDKIKEFESRKHSLPEIITFNVGGSIYKTKTSNVLKFKDCLFYYFLSQESKFPEVLVINRSNKYFEDILNFMKLGLFDLDKYGIEELRELSEEIKYYNLSEMEEFINTQIDLNEPYLESYVSTSGHYQYNYQVEGSTDIASLLFSDDDSGMTFNTPGNVVFKINSSQVLTGFSFKSYNSSYFSYTNGSNSNVSISTDGVNFSPEGQLPAFLSNTIQTFNFNSPKKVLYIKIENPYGYLGFSYFKLNR